MTEAPDPQVLTQAGEQPEPAHAPEPGEPTPPAPTPPAPTPPAPTPPAPGPTAPEPPAPPSQPQPVPPEVPGPPEPPGPPHTGDTAVDEAIEALDGVTRRSPEEQVEIYVGVHRRLQDRLADLDG